MVSKLRCTAWGGVRVSTTKEIIGAIPTRVTPCSGGGRFLALRGPRVLKRASLANFARARLSRPLEASFL